MKNQKDSWDVLAVNLGLESEPAVEQEPKKCEAELVVPQVTEEAVVREPVAEKIIVKEKAVIAESAVVAETTESEVYEVDFFGAGILDEPKKKAVSRPAAISPAVQQNNILPDNIPQSSTSQNSVSQNSVPVETAQNPQREQKKSFLGRFAKMNIFGAPAAKEPPPVHGKNQRHSAKAVTSFASKTVETSAVPLNHTIKPENPAAVVAEKKELPLDTEQNGAEGNPWGKLVSQIESRGEEQYSDKKKFSRRPPSMFADEPVESKEVRALRNIIDNEEVREDAAERLNSIFNDEDVVDDRSYKSTPSQRQRQNPREQRDNRERDNGDRDNRGSRQSDSEERDYPSRSRGKRGSKFEHQEYVEEQKFQEEESDFPSWEEESDEVKPAERPSKNRGSRGSRSEYKQDYQERPERQSFQKREKRTISGHFNDDTEDFILDDEDEVVSVDPVLVQAAKTALGWDDAISGIIDGNIRRHQSGGGNGNYRQNRR